MAFVTINPAYRGLLGRHGLDRAGRLTALPGLIVTGHPDRNVSRVMIGDTTAYLKREHRVLWRDRLLSAAAGFGFASLCVREARTLAALRAAGVASCPDWVAAGEDDRGRAFLLLADLPGTVDLRHFLREGPPAERRRFARRLGAAVARVHAAGFAHGDLYAKHVLIDPATGQCYFLDWQRAPRGGWLGRGARDRDLATLDATLAAELATERERLACLAGYVDVSEALRGVGECHADARPPRPVLLRGSRGRASAWHGPRQEVTGLAARKRFARDVRRTASRLLRKRHVRQERASPAPVAAQGIRWLDGEALCVTQDFWEELAGEIPQWLPLPAGRRGTAEGVVALPGGRSGLLVRRWSDAPLSWLWHALRRRPLLSPELRRAGLFFRRQKHGLPAPRVLAFGQRRPRPWRLESFLLTELAGPEEGARW